MSLSQPPSGPQAKKPANKAQLKSGPALTVIGAYEQLRGKYGAASEVFCGLNVAPAWKDNSGDRKSPLLKPWIWEILGAHVFIGRFTKGAFHWDRRTEPPPTRIKFFTDPDGEKEMRDGLVKHLIEDYENRLGSPETPVGVLRSGDVTPIDASGCAHPWLGFVSELWRLPAPLPELLGVSSMWSTQASLPSDRLLVLPVWKVADEVWQPSEKGWTNKDHTWTIPYEPAKPPSSGLTFALQIALPDPTRSGAFLNVNDLTASIQSDQLDTIDEVTTALRSATARLWDKWRVDGGRAVPLWLMGFKGQVWRASNGTNGLFPVSNISALVSAQVQGKNGNAPSLATLDSATDAPRRSGFLDTLPKTMTDGYRSLLTTEALRDLDSWLARADASRDMQRWLVDSTVASLLKSALSAASQTPPLGPPEAAAVQIKSMYEELGVAIELAATELDSLELLRLAKARPKVTGPLAFQFDQPWRRDGAEDANDLLRRINGVGLLLRRADGGKKWRCPNVAAVRHVPWDMGRRKQRGLGEFEEKEASYPAVILSSRIVDMGSSRGSVISYDNAPLGALSPLSFWHQPETKYQSPLDFVDALAPYAPGSPRPLGDWGRLPDLAFGYEFEATGFLLSQTNALPPALADLRNPTRLKPSPDGVSVDWQVSKKRYLRDAPIGAPRIQVENDLDNPFKVPDDVILRSQDFRKRFDIDRSEKSHNRGESESLPTLLLTTPEGYRNSVALPVLPPVCDFKTWDRWQAAEPWTQAIADDRVSKLEAFLEKRRTDLDDPATNGYYQARLRNLTGDNPEKWSKRMAYRDPARPLLILTVGGRGDAMEWHDDKGFTIPAGHVFRLDVFPELDETRKDRFFNFDAQLSPEGTQQQPLGRPATILVESATPEMPRFDPREKSSLSATLGADSRSIQLSLELSSTHPFAENVGSATLARQVWRWDGRSGDAFPWGKVGQAGVPLISLDQMSDEIKGWDAAHFSEQTRDDAVHSSFTGDLRPQGERVASFMATEPLPDDRARFYRFGFVVRSRYAGAFPTLRLESGTFAGGDDIPWRRVVVRQRNPPASVKAPSVKLILPLTSSAPPKDTVNGTPAEFESHAPLLLVLDEGWYEIGGLTEQIEGDVVEQGPDPRFSGEDSADICKRRISLEGPVGFTFDRSADGARYATAGFCIQPPLNDISQFGWLAKLRFRRVLKGEGLVSGSDLRSDWTPSYWSQFVRTFDRIGPKRPDPINLPTSRSGALRIEAKEPRPPENERFFYDFGVLTQVVRDLAGGPAQERFVDFLVRRGTLFVPESGSAPLMEGRYRCRFAEVELSQIALARPADPTKKPVTPAEMWVSDFIQTWLFAPTDNGREEDARARIVGWSPPLEVNVGLVKEVRN